MLEQDTKAKQQIIKENVSNLTIKNYKSHYKHHNQIIPMGTDREKLSTMHIAHKRLVWRK